MAWDRNADGRALLLGDGARKAYRRRQPQQPVNVSEQPLDPGGAMNERQVDEMVDELERALMVDDPEFARRILRVQRDETVNFVVVFVLLAVGAVLLTVGLATAFVIPWLAGIASLLTAVLVDDHHKRALRDPR
jgi:hypothetical protein